MMERQRFNTIVAAYGADPKRWPKAERESALQLMRAEAIDLSEARALDALLDLAAPTPAPSDLLTRRVLRAAPKSTFRPARLGWAVAATALIGALVGYGAGAVAPAGHGDSDEVLALALDPLSGGEAMH